MSDITYRYRDLIERIHVPDDYASEFEESAVDTGWLVEAVDSLSEAADLIEQLQARIAELEQDNATQHALIIRQSEILTNAVNAAKGKPEIGLHSHHDLAEIVAELVQRNRELVSYFRESDALLSKVVDDSECGVVPRSHLDKIEKLLTQSPSQTLLLLTEQVY